MDGPKLPKLNRSGVPVSTLVPLHASVIPDIEKSCRVTIPLSRSRMSRYNLFASPFTRSQLVNTCCSLSLLSGCLSRNFSQEVAPIIALITIKRVYFLCIMITALEGYVNAQIKYFLNRIPVTPGISFGVYIKSGQFIPGSQVHALGIE